MIGDECVEDESFEVFFYFDEFEEFCIFKG